MLPTIDEALKELEIAEKLNPGPWVKHSMNTGLAARNIAEKVPGMDPVKAYIVGILHDIGRRVGMVDIPTHVYEGYKYCMDKGWDEVARICMTHSYLQMQDEFCYEPETEHEKAIKDFIMDCTADNYDKLIQLCDSLAVDYGFVILEKRFVDVTRRYGIMEGYIKGWEVAFDIKEYFERQMGCSIYSVLPGIGQTSLLTPKPWKPPVNKDIKWIFFDMGSTLLDESGVYKDIFHRIARSADVTDEYVYEKALEFYKQNKKGDKEVARLLEVASPEWNPELEALYGDTEECLLELGRNYKIGIIANQMYGSEKRLENFGILKYLDLVVASAEEGIEKPDKRIFQLALDRAGCTADQAVMVGDRIDNDIVPARAMGMKTIWIKQGFGRYWKKNGESETPDYEVSSLTELMDIL